MQYECRKMDDKMKSQKTLIIFAGGRERERERVQKSCSSSVFHWNEWKTDS